MWNANNQDLKMCEGDWGIQLPVTVSGTTLSAQDELKFTFKSIINGHVILEKTFSGISENTVNLELTEAESALFTVGTYYYCLDWYQNGVFMCNIIPIAQFKVVDKA